MNADDAIRSHRDWKERFRTVMATKGRMDVKQTSADNACAFGKWLHSDGRAVVFHEAAYSRCLALHAAFHLAAGKIAALVNEGRYLEAERLLAPGTPYADASQDFVMSVGTLFADDIAVGGPDR